MKAPLKTSPNERDLRSSGRLRRKSCTPSASATTSTICWAACMSRCKECWTRRIALWRSTNRLREYSIFLSLWTKSNRYPPPQMVWRSCAAYVYRAGRAMMISAEALLRTWSRRRKWNYPEIRLPPGWVFRCERPLARLACWSYRTTSERMPIPQRDLEFFPPSATRSRLRLSVSAAESKHPRKRSTPASADRAVARRALDGRQGPPLYIGAWRWARATGAQAESDRRSSRCRNILRPPIPTFLPFAAHRRAVAGEPATFHVEWKNGSYACHVEPLRGGRRRGAGRDLHGPGYHRPQGTRGALPPSAKNGSGRPPGGRNRARFQ